MVANSRRLQIDRTTGLGQIVSIPWFNNGIRTGELKPNVRSSDSLVAIVELERMPRFGI